MTVLHGYCYRRGSNLDDHPEVWVLPASVPLEVEFRAGSRIGTARVRRDESRNLVCTAELDETAAAPALLAEHPLFGIGVKFDRYPMGEVWRVSVVAENVDRFLPPYRVEDAGARIAVP